MPEQQSGVGCACGWPLDSCNPTHAKGEPCGEKRHLDSFRIPVLTRSEATNIVRSIFRRCGYAIGEHGTRGRDLDLMAVPWNDRAGVPDLIVEEVVESLPGVVLGKPEEKPHGRVAWAIQPFYRARHDMWYLDLSVVVPEQYR